MILVDTSVIIDLLRKRSNEPAENFRKILTNQTPFCISSLTYHELLQGTKTDVEYSALEEYLDTLKICHLPNDNNFYKMSSKIYRDIRKQGQTIRSVVDVFIAAMAIKYDLSLLHNDKDFDVIAEYTEHLKIYR